MSVQSPYLRLAMALTIGFPVIQNHSAEAHPFMEMMEPGPFHDARFQMGFVRYWKSANGLKERIIIQQGASEICQWNVGSSQVYRMQRDDMGSKTILFEGDIVPAFSQILDTMRLVMATTTENAPLSQPVLQELEKPVAEAGAVCHMILGHAETAFPPLTELSHLAAGDSLIVLPVFSDESLRGSAVLKAEYPTSTWVNLGNDLMAARVTYPDTALPDETWLRSPTLEVIYAGSDTGKPESVRIIDRTTGTSCRFEADQSMANRGDGSHIFFADQRFSVEGIKPLLPVMEEVSAVLDGQKAISTASLRNALRRAGESQCMRATS